MFFYCCTAQYQHLFGPALIPPDSPWRQKSNPIMYSSENARAKQPVVGFMMPIAFRQTEKLNS